MNIKYKPEIRRAKYAYVRSKGEDPGWANRMKDWHSTKLFKYFGLPVPPLKERRDMGLVNPYFYPGDKVWFLAGQMSDTLLHGTIESVPEDKNFERYSIISDKGDRYRIYHFEIFKKRPPSVKKAKEYRFLLDRNPDSTLKRRRKMARNITLKGYDQPGWHYGDSVRIKPIGGMKEFYGKTGTVIGAEGEYLRIRLDFPVDIHGVGRVSDDLWMPYTLKKIRSKSINPTKYISGEAVILLSTQGDVPRGTNGFVARVVMSSAKRTSYEKRHIPIKAYEVYFPDYDVTLLVEDYNLSGVEGASNPAPKGFWGGKSRDLWSGSPIERGFEAREGKPKQEEKESWADFLGLKKHSTVKGGKRTFQGMNPIITDSKNPKCCFDHPLKKLNKKSYYCPICGKTWHVIKKRPEDR